MTPPLLDRIFQIAYVTNDVAQAEALFREGFGTGSFTRMDPPGGFMRISLAFAQQTMIELIEPIGDTVELYAKWIAGREGFVVRHHHFGMLVDSKAELAAIRAAHVENGTAVAMEGEMPGALDYLYVDTTPALGHFLEYIRLEEGGRAMFAAVEGSTFQAT
ncbi:VOC family protein [Novosphingobium tardum]|uniref:VOC family protein n=1 Tax=Novosphingobium tardum TaxID=1538021 RepID=A0ABV8RNP5_9SPHN